MKEKIQELRELFAGNLAEVTDLQTLESMRVDFLGKKGKVSGLMKELGKVPVEQKKEFGQVINVFKQEVNEQLEAKKAALILEEENRAIEVQSLMMSLCRLRAHAVLIIQSH